MEKYCKKISIRLMAFFLLLFFINTNIFANESKWWTSIKKVKLFETNRNDFERMFDTFVINYTKQFTDHIVVSYTSKIGDLRAAYSVSNCTTEEKLVIEKDTLIDFSFWLEKPVKISKLKLDLSGFGKGFETDTDTEIYSNKDHTLTYYVLPNNKLTGISFSTPAKFKNLTCDEK